MGKSLVDSRVTQRQGAGRIPAFSVNFEVRWNRTKLKLNSLWTEMKGSK